MAKPDPRDAMVKAMEAIAGRMLAAIPDNPVGRQMQAEVNRMRQGAEALDRMRRSRSPLDTEAAHALKVAKAARKYNQEVTAGINRASQTWAAAYHEIAAAIEDKVNLRPDAFAKEIRTAFRAMPEEQRLKEMAKLIDENRGPELAAILKAPSSITGVTEEQRAAFESTFVAKHAAEEVALQGHLEEALSAVSAASRAASSLVRDMTDPGRLAEIESGAAAAADATQAFDQSLQQ